MNMFNSIKRQLRSVIQWENPSADTLFWRWSENGDEIKNASKLLVNPGQGVIFVYEGKVQAIHTDEGLYELETANIPFWTTITKVMQAFVSEHKVGIYFFWKTEFLNQKWGTKSPIKYVDLTYNFPVGLRAFGNFSFKITDPTKFFVSIVGGRDVFRSDEASQVIADRILQPLTDALAKSGYSYIEVDKKRDDLSATLREKVAPDFEKLGFSMTDFRIENTDFDEGTQQRIARIADVGAEAQAAKSVGMSYTELQKVSALRDAAKNEGGAAGMGVGIGAGISLGQTMSNAMTSGASGGSSASRLEELKKMHKKKLISDEEFEKKKAEILSNL